MAIEDDIEMRWVNAWNDMYDIVGDRRDVRCLLPNGQVVDTEACRGWLQEQVYEGWSVKAEPSWVLGKQGIVASRWQ